MNDLPATYVIAHLQGRGASLGRPGLILIFIAALQLSAGPSLAEETPGKSAGDSSSKPGESQWNVFRGGEAQNGYRPTSPGDAPRLRWAFDIGEGVEATAAISGARVFVASVDGKVCALDLLATDKKGKKVWQQKAEGGVRSSPGVKDGKVFFGDDFGFVYSLDSATGKILWKYETEGGAEIISSVNFHKGFLLVGSYDGNLYCLERSSGKLAWKAETGAPVHCSPAISQGKTFVAGCDGLLRVIDVNEGKEVSQLELGENTAASPAVQGNQLYVGTYGSQVKAVDWKAGKILWTYEHPVRRFPYYASAALSDTLVVIGGRDKFIHGLDRKSGKAVWTFTTRARVESSPVIVGSRVICGSSDKNIYMLDLATGRKIWSFEGDGSFVSSAAIASGQMVMGCDSGLVYCFDMKPTAKAGSR